MQPPYNQPQLKPKQRVPWWLAMVLTIVVGGAILIPLTLVLVANFDKWSVNQVASAFKAAGLEVENPTNIDPSSIAPHTEKEFLGFAIPSQSTQFIKSGGSIFSFSTKADMDTLKRFFDSFSSATAIGSAYVYIKDNIMVVIPSNIAKPIAEKYRAALENL